MVQSWAQSLFRELLEDARSGGSGEGGAAGREGLGDVTGMGAACLRECGQLRRGPVLSEDPSRRRRRGFDVVATQS